MISDIERFTIKDKEWLQSVFQDAQDNYNTIRRIYQETGYDKIYPLGGHWLTNMRQLVEIIGAEGDPLANIGKIHETVMYSINTSQTAIKEKMVQWYIKLFQERYDGLNQLPLQVQESVYSNPQNSSLYQGRLVSPDFLRTVVLCLEMRKYCSFPKNKFLVMELGAGYGGLARTFKLFHPQATCVITDIPETMYFSYLFMRMNFPEAKICYVSGASSLKSPLEEYDFVFVPTKFAEIFAEQKFELFYNTASLGEMKNSVIRYWMDFVQNKAQVKYFFGLNRFLNTMDPVYDQWRKDENCCSVSFDDQWAIRHWEVDPLLARCPYLETLVSRNLEIVAERLTSDKVDPQENLRRSKELIDKIVLEDWFTRPGVVDAKIALGMEIWPLRHTRADNNLTPDLTKEGTLFALWESIRLAPSLQNVSLMLKYFEYLAQRKPFEEAFFYAQLYRSLGGSAPEYENEKLQQSSAFRKIISRLLPSTIKRFLKRLILGNG